MHKRARAYSNGVVLLGDRAFFFLQLVTGFSVRKPERLTIYSIAVGVLAELILTYWSRWACGISVPRSVVEYAHKCLSYYNSKRSRFV